MINHMTMDDFLGPFCMEIQLSQKQINDLTTIKPLTGQTIKNGVLLELQAHFKNVNKVIEVLNVLQPDLSSSNVSSLKTKINRVLETKKKLVSRKKVNGISSVNELNCKPFGTPSKSRKLFITPCKNSVQNDAESDSLIKESTLVSPRQTETEISSSEFNSERTEHEKKEPNSDPPVSADFSQDEMKKLNLYVYEINRKKKALKRVNQEIELLKEKVEVQERKIGHFSIRNVNKRDETARKNLHLLRETERQLLRQKRLEVTNSETIEQLTLENISLKEQQNEQQKNETKLLQQKKLQAQKTASYYKVRATKLHEKFNNKVKDSDIVKSLRSKINECEAKICELEINTDILKEQITQHACETKNCDGTFNDNLRMCIIELSGLEVAVEKVPSVIKTVSKHLFGKELGKTDLPSSTTVQTIADEGHYLAKTFISEQLSEAENWGINRDGTTRRKQKILDTTVTLSSGDVLSLGFNRVARETAETINNVTKSHLNELANLNASVNSGVDIESYVKSSLEKLAFTMSDRASNEKKADKLLDDWRDEVLSSCDDSQHGEVLHFHCMAHVLLGFHRYICTDLKEYELSLAAEHGALGRDAMSVFKFWKTKGTVVERTLRTVSEVFGPAGDHHGVRDLWEAHCAANGLKSIIGNYKDNRFNALFQTAAEVHLHRAHFILVLETVKIPNLKLKSVLADLKSDEIMTLVQCLGLFYIRITGPYWALLTGNKVPYVELYREINDLKNFLEICEQNPEILLNVNTHWSENDPHEIRNIPYRQLLTSEISVMNKAENRLQVQCQEILLHTVKLVATSMIRTINKQLIDFLPEGKFGAEPSKDSLRRTAYAHVTNLSCEHHFGDLDSSQRRRPSASMHHHSTVQLLKRNRLHMMNWLDDMPECQLQEVMKKARKGGKSLREKHRKQEKDVLRTINDAMCNTKVSKGKKRKLNHETSSKQKCMEFENSADENEFDDENELRQNLPLNETIQENVYVAIAYQDAWYPGIVLKVNHANETFVVKFMSPARKAGHFCWPAREDIQTVEKDFILKKGFVPNCVNSGRMWQIEEINEIEKLFVKFKKFYF